MRPPPAACCNHATWLPPAAAALTGAACCLECQQPACVCPKPLCRQIADRRYGHLRCFLNAAGPGLCLQQGQEQCGLHSLPRGQDCSASAPRWWLAASSCSCSLRGRPATERWRCWQWAARCTRRQPSRRRLRLSRFGLCATVRCPVLDLLKHSSLSWIQRRRLHARIPNHPCIQRHCGAARRTCAVSADPSPLPP